MLKRLKQEEDAKKAPAEATQTEARPAVEKKVAAKEEEKVEEDMSSQKQNDPEARKRKEMIAYFEK
jgi:hypothetical protein